MNDVLLRESGPVFPTVADYQYLPALHKRLLLSRRSWVMYVVCVLGLLVFLAFEMDLAGSSAILLAIFAIAGIAIFLRYTRFCPECRLLLIQQSKTKGAEWCSLCGRLVSQSLLLSVEGRLDVTPATLERLVHCDPVFKVVSLLLFLLIDDDVDVVVLQPEYQDYRFYAVRNESIFELEPPPPEIHRKIVAVVKSIFDANNSPDSRLFVHREYDGYEMRATIKQSEFGDILTIYFRK